MTFPFSISKKITKIIERTMKGCTFFYAGYTSTPVNLQNNHNVPVGGCHSPNSLQREVHLLAMRTFMYDFSIQ